MLTGIGTVVSDNPLLTCRLPGMAIRSPVRLVLDSNLRLPTASKLVSSAKTTPLWVMISSQARQDREIALADNGAEVFRVSGREGKLDLMEVFRLLASRGITRLMVESGPKIAAAVIDAGLADEIALFRAEKTVGSDGLDALVDMPLTAITGSPRFRLRDNDTVGDDRLEVYERT